MSSQKRTGSTKKRLSKFVREIGGGEIIVKDGKKGYFFPDTRAFILPADLGYNRLIGFYNLSKFPEVENKLIEEKTSWEAGESDIPRPSQDEIKQAWDQFWIDQHFL